MNKINFDPQLKHIIEPLRYNNLNCGSHSGVFIDKDLLDDRKLNAFIIPVYHLIDMIFSESIAFFMRDLRLS